MRKLAKFILICAAATLMLGQSVSHSQERIKETIGGVIETGVISFVENTHGNRSRAKEALTHNAVDPGTSAAVYNSSGGTTGSDGWIDVRDYNDEMIWHVDLDTLGSTSMTVTFESLISDGTGTHMLLYAKVFTAGTSTYNLPLAEGAVKYVRSSTQAGGTKGTDTISIRFRGEGAKN